MAQLVEGKIIFYSQNENEIQKMHDDFHGVYRTNRVLHKAFSLLPFAKEYLPNLTEEQFNEIERQGFLYKILAVTRSSFYTDSFGLYTNSANKGYFCFEVRTVTDKTAKIGLFRYIAEKFYPSVKIAYCASNSEDGYYVKYDEEGVFPFPVYHVEGQVPLNEWTDDTKGHISDDYCTIGEINELFSLILPCEFDSQTNLEKCVKGINEKLDGLSEQDENGEKYFIEVSEYREVPPDKYGLWD